MSPDGCRLPKGLGEVGSKYPLLWWLLWKRKHDMAVCSWQITWKPSNEYPSFTYYPGRNQPSAVLLAVLDRKG